MSPSSERKADDHSSGDRQCTEPPDTGICAHIFGASTAMVGVCLTVIGIVQVVVAMKRMTTIADDLLAITSLLFLVACLPSYWALHSRGSPHTRSLERIAHVMFLLGMVLVVIAGGMLTYAFALGGKG